MLKIYLIYIFVYLPVLVILITYNYTTWIIYSFEVIVIFWISYVYLLKSTKI